MQDKILENTLAIAKSLSLEQALIEYCHVIYRTKYDWKIFAPYQDDADAFKVLEAGIEKVGAAWFLAEVTNIIRLKKKTLHEAICETYLSLIQQEEV